MRLRVLTALLATGAFEQSGREARAESQTRQTIEGVKELTAPASRLELRGDVGLLAARRPGDGRAGVDVEIAPRPDYWYGLGAAAIVRSTTTTTTTGDGTVVTTVETTESVGVSARFFKRLGPLVLSAGLVDGKGGAALEVRAFEDRLRLEVLTSNWRPSEPAAVPRLRVGGSAQWRFLYVQAGALDVLEDARGSAFVGVGLRWRDPDLLATLWWLSH